MDSSTAFVTASFIGDVGSWASLQVYRAKGVASKRSKPASQPANQPTSQPANQPTNQPTSQLANDP
ncbi:MAG: hypothetical protein CVV18_06020 [Gammaproteobacteria bacterium HGW-Gammaproteobacteria-8]|nr:MAG: hypothetical protein CVV18_06020 [Gammaproteobacteria bacterium HGW-Gammaproteobacteria-8]